MIIGSSRAPLIEDCQRNMLISKDGYYRKPLTNELGSNSDYSSIGPASSSLVSESNNTRKFSNPVGPLS